MRIQTLLLASLWLAAASAADASDRKQAVYSSQSRGAEHARQERQPAPQGRANSRDSWQVANDDHRGGGRGHDQHGRGNGYGHDNDRGRGHGSGHDSGDHHRDRDNDRHGTHWQGDRHQHYRDYNVVHHYPAPHQPRVIYVRDHYGHHRNYHLDVAWHGHFYDPVYYHGGVHVHTGCHYHHFGDALVTGVAIGLILGNW